MNWSSKIVRLGLALAALAISLPAMTQDTGASLLQYDGPDRAQKLLAAAQKEGTLTLYTSLAEKNLPSLIEPFEKKYGIKVKVWRAGQTKVLQRTLTEASAGRYEADAIHFGSPELEALHREKILQPVKSPYFSELIAGAVPAHREWASTMLQVYVQAYNTNQIKKEDLPKSYEDLLDPKWKGKLGVETKSEAWYSTLMLAMGEEKGVKLFRDIVARNGMSMRFGYSLLTNMVVAGEVPLALTMYSHMPQAAKEKGAPIDWFALQPTIARANGIGIARRAPHPHAALLFYEYMLSAAGAQKTLAEMDYVPTNSGFPSPLPNLSIKLVDPAVMLDQLDKWTKSFEETFAKRGGQ
jgi:iron(III) transport system substrate-binding protein